MPRERTAKNWVFTWNNYPANYQEIIRDKTNYLKENDGISTVFLLCGEEVGENGTPHLQGMICFDKALSRPSQRLWQAHFDVCRNPRKADEYCRKGNQSKEE